MRDMSGYATNQELGLIRLSCLLHQFDFAGLPALVKPRGQWTVEAQERIPAFAGYRLHPVRFVPCEGADATVIIYRVSQLR